MLAETSNNITGSTINPFVKKFSSGSAAGGMLLLYSVLISLKVEKCIGEGALLAMRAPPLGFATDIGKFDAE